MQLHTAFASLKSGTHEPIFTFYHSYFHKRMSFSKSMGSEKYNIHQEPYSPRALNLFALYLIVLYSDLIFLFLVRIPNHSFKISYKNDI